MIRVLFICILITVLTGCSGGITEVETGDYDSVVQSGWDSYNASSYDDAKQYFLNAKDSDETRPEAYIGCGWTLLHQQDPYGAIVNFRDAFDYIAGVNDSVEALCGYAGAYLATGENTNVINLFNKYSISSYDDAFPFRKHDLSINKGDLDIVQAMAFYRLGIYSSAEQPDPGNAIYHLNEALYRPYEYVDPQGLMEKITSYLGQSGGYYKW